MAKSAKPLAMTLTMLSSASEKIADEPVKPQAAVARSQIWLWVGMGVGLQLLAVLLWVVYLFNPFAEAKSPAPTQPTTPVPFKSPAKKAAK